MDHKLGILLAVMGAASAAEAGNHRRLQRMDGHGALGHRRSGLGRGHSEASAVGRRRLTAEEGGCTAVRGSQVEILISAIGLFFLRRRPAWARG
jgi:hypothetical protein